MACITCHTDTNDTKWGPWCDVCGGVSIKPGQLLLRHVATIYGPGGRFPIVYDLSTSDYAYMFKDPHPELHARGVVDVDGFRKPIMRVAHGSLDAMIALSYPDVAGDGAEGPFLAASPVATQEERQLMGV